MMTQKFSMRDQLIIAQALVLGIRELDKVPGVMKEVSNILDMKYLLNTQFASWVLPAQLMVKETERINTKQEVK